MNSHPVVNSLVDGGIPYNCEPAINRSEGFPNRRHVSLSPHDERIHPATAIGSPRIV